MHRRLVLVAATALAWLSLGADIDASGLGCTVSATTPSFASYVPASGSAVTASGTAHVACTIGGTVVVTISSGSGTVAARKLVASGGATLNYNLYTDVNHTLVWGDGVTGNSVTLNVPTLLGGASAPVYGLVPGGQDVPVGTYSSTLTMTATF